MASKENIQTSEEILKANGSLDDAAKLKLMVSKYDELSQLFRKQELGYNSSKRELSTMSAEKNKQILARSRLESLCRELQKQNKTIKDENMLKICDEEEKRKKLTEEFQKSLNNVTQMMTESNAQNTKLGEENRQMAQRLSSIYEEFKARENEVDRITKQMDIERQLAEAQNAKVKTEFLIEKQTLLSENDTLNVKVASLTKELTTTGSRCELLEYRIVELTAEIDKYSARYGEFENTITRSGKIFDQCKGEMNRMTKQIKTLEKEVIEWQTRYHKAVSAMYEVQLESTEKSRLIGDVTRKMNQLTKLCRQLQVERKAYLNALRELGKDPKDILVEAPAEDPMIEELMNPISSNAATAESDDARLGTKPKLTLKAKRGNKNKGKKTKDAPVAATLPMTPKQIELAELKRELQKVEALMQFQTEAIQTPLSESDGNGNLEDDKNDKTEEGFVLEAAGDGPGLVCISQGTSGVNFHVEQTAVDQGNIIDGSDDSFYDSPGTSTDENLDTISVDGEKKIEELPDDSGSAPVENSLEEEIILDEKEIENTETKKNV